MASAGSALADLNARAVPDWYQDAKFGIFIHWGAFAIPGFAPRLGSIGEAFARDYDRAVAMVPYTEWYCNAIKVPGTPSAEFHRAHYGDAPYEDFKPPFEAGLDRWDPAAWAEAFRDAGARYVVLVTKHHDGLCLWPSQVANPHRTGWTTGRDIVGDLAAAVRAAGLRFGVYYSGGIDWTFNRRPLRTLGDFLASTPGGEYPAYAMAQVRELIDRYEPSVLWNDISWPTRAGPLYRLFADYYRAVPDGVVNDRWVAASLQRDALKIPLVRRYVDRKIKAAIARQGADASKGIIPPEIPHSDFRTPEYAAFTEIQTKKWEATRGMSHSFGFNRNDTEADYASAETLIHDFIDAVSRNGNLLLNVGPRATDAAIPGEQLGRLRQFGAWLRAHGDAIYGTRPWTRSDGETECGQAVRFTAAPGRVNLIFKGPIASTRLVIRNLTVTGAGRRLDDGSPVTLEPQGPDLRVTFTGPCTDPIGTAVAVAV
ncbi:MAG TPA: alpha-L-fucosidase [Sphingopyxis sp.]|uniref:alpha-L-fucosidase n=1 Tax=Sphingopyxis sp. TaxID=1908224 RepID=UPI002E342E74|nr:alpha-L-fucosidase [Sphingopyxis sp.]HEX2814387.1 alpha-L-fucosidase [Sphingopyxis sp.]